MHPTFEIHNYNIREGKTNEILLPPFKAVIIQTDPRMLGDTLVANEVLNARRMAHGEEKAAQALRVMLGGERDLVIV